MERKFLQALSLSALLLSSAVSAQTWNCETKGEWTDASGSAAGFTWLMVWEAGQDSWSVTGSGSDDFGNYTLAGECDTSDCEFMQYYATGDLVNKPYAWVGSYNEKILSDTATTMRLNGNWSGADADEAGSWTASARCSLKN